MQDPNAMPILAPMADFLEDVVTRQLAQAIDRLRSGVASGR
jgi:hypothetical protein